VAGHIVPEDRVALQGFETRIERMVDGVFSRAFRSSLKPIELGRRLVKEMDDRRTLDVHGRAVVPNVFTFSLSPADHHTFSAIEAPLVRELVDAAKEHARDEGYGFLGPLRVELTVDDTLRSGRFGLVAEMTTGRAATPAAGSSGVKVVQAPAPASAPVAAAPAVAVAPAAPPAEELAPSWTNEGPAWGAGLPEGATKVETAATEPAAATEPVPATATLVAATGERHPLAAGRTVTLGRLPACEVVLADPNVSRRHAEVRPGTDGTWTIVDLGSTNGTRVNGAPVDTHTLRHEDVITVGGTRLRFEVR
jgi:hypothetical protein